MTVRDVTNRLSGAVAAALVLWAGAAPASAAGPTLADTGAEITGIALIALVLIGAGVLLMWRRRSTADSAPSDGADVSEEDPNAPGGPVG
ncbi:MAG: LPXTG cell wall anchor domain-containing protein [Bowdeniella nasicola]|nr:LPXTG cell wall anchor domain-containing protein [Bowdeniella nasicola]